MPGTTDAIAITTEDMQFDTITPAQAFEMVQSAMKKGQEAMDALSPKIKKLAKQHAEKELPDADFSAYA
tara:strand:+ start:4425 stop:4631 length:207 start_codon:yes stop_codon:yes gene_type:complete